MEYTVQKLGRLAGISTRTLRYYDEIDLLKPARINSSGYRIYGQAEVRKLQQVLFYRELGIPLEQIGEILSAPGFDELEALRNHHKQLLERRMQLDELIANVEKTINAEKEKSLMEDKERFSGFTRKLVDENEKKYGKEIREKYGDSEVDASNRKVLNMSEEEYKRVEKLGVDILAALKEAAGQGPPESEAAQKVVEMHREWLGTYWNHYSKEAHAGLGDMYIVDERFTAYYDKEEPGLAKYLRDAIYVYAGMKP